MGSPIEAQSGFTPGPWMVPHFATNSSCNCQSVVSDNQHGMGAIATVHHDGEADGGHNEPMSVAIANARLIAASPDLLDALKSCRRELDYCQRQLAAFGQTGSANDSVSRALNESAAAIAKATGGAA